MKWMVDFLLAGLIGLTLAFIFFFLDGLGATLEHFLLALLIRLFLVLIFILLFLTARIFQHASIFGGFGTCLEPRGWLVYAAIDCAISLIVAEEVWADHALDWLLAVSPLLATNQLLFGSKRVGFCISLGT